MNTTTLISKQLRDVYFGGNWTWVNLRDTLSDITYVEATTKLEGYNTIATLAYHINYYVNGIYPLLNGGTLDISDKYAFNVPEMTSQADWERLLNCMWDDGKKLADLIEKLPDDILFTTFVEEKYGNYYRNFCGIIEHTHYHLGQIVIIKKMIRQKNNT